MKEIVLEVNSYQAMRTAELLKKYVEIQKKFQNIRVLVLWTDW